MNLTARPIFQKSPKAKPSAETLNRVLNYNQYTGELTWRKRSADLFHPEKETPEFACEKWNLRWAGKPAFYARHNKGYLYGTLFGKKYLTHRVVYAMFYGDWLSDDLQIDHLNGVRTDNRICNLRAATNQQNSLNHKRSIRNSSGVVGVSWCNTYQKWVAHIAANGRPMTIGRFDIKEDAIFARKRAEREFGYHKNHGRD